MMSLFLPIMVPNPFFGKYLLHCGKLGLKFMAHGADKQTEKKIKHH